jgi:hypothetical protein
MSHLSIARRQATLPAEPLQKPADAITAIHAVMVPVLAAWASAF